jgi:mannitol/fructose-specific phosphotransferase system IIA component (Ntr-type)
VTDIGLLLTELLPPDRIRVPLQARDKAGVLRELVQLLADRVGGDPAQILAAVQEREGVLSTGIGNGIAIPHAKAASVKELSLVCGSSPVGIPFEAVDGQPVRLFFLLVGPEQAAGQHVKALSRIARLLRREPVREALLKAETPASFHQALVEAEEL